jgi:hypothetical protein
MCRLPSEEMRYSFGEDVAPQLLCHGANAN